MFKCENCKSTNWVEKNYEGDTYWHCRDCGRTIENGILTAKGRKKGQKNKALERLARIVEKGWEYNADMITEKQRREANILWVCRVLETNIGAIKRIKI